MKRVFFFGIFVAVLGLLLCCSCAPYALVDGKRVEVLSDAEELELMEYARSIALHSSAKLGLTPAQTEFVRRTKPETQLFYYSDRAGRATYDWVFDEKRTLRLGFGGRFFSEEMLFRAQVINNTAVSSGEDKNMRLLKSGSETEDNQL